MTTTISVRFVRADDGKTHEIEVNRRLLCRDVQRLLCHAFGERFPAMQADLYYQGHLFDDFGQCPFAAAGNGAIFEAPSSGKRLTTSNKSRNRHAGVGGVAMAT